MALAAELKPDRSFWPEVWCTMVARVWLKGFKMMWYPKKYFQTTFENTLTTLGSHMIRKLKRAYQVYIKYSAFLIFLHFFNIKKTQTKQNKNIDQDNCGERSLMLKLHLSGTEMRYLPESSEQGPYSPAPALNNTIADSYRILCESKQGENQKDRPNKGNFRPCT